MKNTFIYYCAIMIPMFVLVLAAKNHVLSSTAFVVLLGLYLLIYRTITDSVRLISKNIISKKDFWKLLLPGSHFKYFRELYLS
jgi:hypothetical protein